MTCDAWRATGADATVSFDSVHSQGQEHAALETSLDELRSTLRHIVGARYSPSFTRGEMAKANLKISPTPWNGNSMYSSLWHQAQQHASADKGYAEFLAGIPIDHSNYITKMNEFLNEKESAAAAKRDKIIDALLISEWLNAALTIYESGCASKHDPPVENEKPFAIFRTHDHFDSTTRDVVASTNSSGDDDAASSLPPSSLLVIAATASLEISVASPPHSTSSLVAAVAADDATSDS
jgi:hypothetical protein